MPLVAFYFIDGPWRHTWVRYGFDPRMEINRDISYLFQTIEIRSHTVAKITSKLSPELFHAPNEFLKDLSNKAVDSQIPVGFDGIHLSSIQGQLQLADISYAPIQSLVTRSLVSVCQVSL